MTDPTNHGVNILTKPGTQTSRAQARFIERRQAQELGLELPLTTEEQPVNEACTLSAWDRGIEPAVSRSYSLGLPLARDRPPRNSVRKSLIIGTTDVFKTKAQAMKAADEHRVRANIGGRESSGLSFGALIEKFIAEERLLEAKCRCRAVGLVKEDEEFDPEILDSSTASSYLSILNVHIRPRWKDVHISGVKPALVQAWLRTLDLAQCRGRDRDAANRRRRDVPGDYAAQPCGNTGDLGRAAA